MPPSLADVAARLNIETGVQLSPTGELQPEFEDEQTVCVCQPVSFVLGVDIDAGQGTLHITTKRVVWTSSSAGTQQQQPQSFALRYQQIVVHAVCKDPQTYARPCIYLQLDEGSEDAMMVGRGGEEDDEGEEEEDVPAEVRLVPDSEEKVQEIFAKLCDCAALNPDSDAEAEGEGDFFFDESEVMAGLDGDTRAAVVASRLAGMLDLAGAADADGPDAPGITYEEDEEDGMEDGDAEANGGDLDELVGDDPSRFEDDDADTVAGGQPAAGQAGPGSGQNGRA